jgi:hypothetical protein
MKAKSLKHGSKPNGLMSEYVQKQIARPEVAGPKSKPNKVLTQKLKIKPFTKPCVLY